MPTKEQMLKAIQDLPTDATVEDAIERLYLLQKKDWGGRSSRSRAESVAG